MSRANCANSGATPTKPRLAEDPDSLWREIQRVSGGVVASEAGSRLLYPTLRVVCGEDYQLAADGRLQILVRGMDGVAVREATSQETEDFHEEVGVIVLFVQIGALWPETQHPCGLPAGDCSAAGPAS